MSLRSLTGPTRALVSPFVSVVSGAILAAMVAVAGRHGQFGEIAGYTAGTGAVSIGAAIASGGTTMRYVTARDLDRTSILRFRRHLVTPALVLSSLLVAASYAGGRAIAFSAVLAGGLATTLANHFELSGGDLQRDGRVISWGAILIIPRLVGLIFIYLGSPFSTVMLLSQLALATAGSILARSSRTLSLTEPEPYLAVARRAHTRDFTLFAIGTAFSLRLPFLVAPWIASPERAGYFAILLTVQQAIATSTTSGLYTLMAMRAKGSLAGSQRFGGTELALIISGSLLSILLIPSGNVILAAIGLPRTQETSTWWTLLMFGLPPLLLNRAFQYRWLACQQPGRAAAMATWCLVATICAAIGAATGASVSTLAVSTLLVEGSWLVTLLLFLPQWRRVDIAR